MFLRKRRLYVDVTRVETLGKQNAKSVQPDDETLTKNRTSLFFYLSSDYFF